jgi:hypothetical protein
VFLAVKHHELANTTEDARDSTDDWADRVDEFEVAELFECVSHTARSQGVTRTRTRPAGRSMGALRVLRL